MVVVVVGYPLRSRACVKGQCSLSQALAHMRTGAGALAHSYTCAKGTCVVHTCVCMKGWGALVGCTCTLAHMHEDAVQVDVCKFLLHRKSGWGEPREI